MVELGGTDGEGNGFRERSQHTFVIEIDRQGARGGGAVKKTEFRV